MPTALRPIRHDEELSIVEHLDELRTRLIISIVAFAVAFGVCLWQNNALLDVVNRPLERTTQSSGNEGGRGRLEQTARSQVQLRDALDALGRATARIASSSTAEAADRAALAAAAREVRQAAALLPSSVPGRQPVTLGVGEPFTTTLTVSAWFALLISLPLILYQLYAFVLPAFSPSERRVALPLMSMIPFLFIAGVVFGYYVVLPPAVRFLQNFNDQSFDILVQAKDYYRFAAFTLLAMGFVFQTPVAILAATRVGVVSVAQLRRNRRYALVVNAVIAMLLPGTDIVTMLLCWLPLVVLYELSILLASAVDRRSRSRAASAPPDDPAITPDD